MWSREQTAASFAADPRAAAAQTQNRHEHIALRVKAIEADAFKALLATEQQVQRSGLDASLLELVKTRASQLNGCAWCLDMHTKDARACGETEQRLYLLSAWREAPCYSDRERAALAWTEAITQIAPHGVPDALYDEVRRHFGEKALVDLTLAVIAINGWNRMNVAFRTEVGGYTSPHAVGR